MQAICVPYRSRPVYLQQFLRLVPPYTNNLPIYLGVQDDDLPFNISLARNIAAWAAIEDGAEDLIFQDIDIIPHTGIDYSPTFATYIWFMAAGGVKIRAAHFLHVNGWNPAFRGWGMEDTEFNARLHNFDYRPIFWPSSEGASEAQIYNLEMPFDANPKQFSKDYFTGDNPPQYIPLPGLNVRHDKTQNWFEPELVRANRALCEYITSLDSQEYYHLNGLNLINFTKMKRQLGRTPGVVSVLFRSDDILSAQVPAPPPPE